MRFDDQLTDDAVLAEIGRRIERQRVQRDLTQERLAYEAGIGRATLQRLERGEAVQTTSLVKLLRALELLGALEAAVPDAGQLPLADLERQRRKVRRRVRARANGRSSEEEQRPWSWGEEPDATP
jgi:putative transcriptional regulator